MIILCEIIERDQDELVAVRKDGGTTVSVRINNANAN